MRMYIGKVVRMHMASSMLVVVVIRKTRVVVRILDPSGSRNV